MNKLKLSVGLLALAGMLFSTPALALSPPYPGSQQLPFIRLYNSKINDHFYTSSYAEASLAQQQHGYKSEGLIGNVESEYKNGTKAIIRMWNPAAKKHFYTTDSNEVVSAQASGFVLEGTVGYIQVDTAPASNESGDNMSSPILWEPGKRTLYRMYNSGVRKHFYTISYSEMQGLLSHGYRLEGDLGTLYDIPQVMPHTD